MAHPSRCLFSLSPSSFLCFAALIVLTTTIVLASPQISGNETDRLALLEIKAKIVNDPTGVLSSWNKSNNFCGWFGVTCGLRHQRVTMLSLKCLNLSGTLSPHIGNLSFLRELHLWNNSFNSGIPMEVGRLFRLEKLFLYNNSFSGYIPSNLSYCTNLLNIRLNKERDNDCNRTPTKSDPDCSFRGISINPFKN